MIPKNRALLLVVPLGAASLTVAVSRSALAQDAGAAPTEPPHGQPDAGAPQKQPEPGPPPLAPPPPTKPLPPASTPVTLDETPEPRRAPPPARKPEARPRPTATAPARSFPPPTPPPEESKPEPARATPPTKPDASSDKPKDADDKDKDKDKDEGSGGLLGPFKIGAFVGVGLPGILTFGGLLKLTDYFGAGVNVGVIPSIKLSMYGDAELSYQEYELYGRLFPFGGALFVGAGVGYATMHGRFNTPIPQVPGFTLPGSITSEGSVRTMVLTPTIGLLHTIALGFTIGLDVGAQVPIAPSQTSFETKVPAQTPTQIRTQYIDPNDKKVKDTLDTVGRSVLPTINLRVGLLF